MVLIEEIDQFLSENNSHFVTFSEILEHVIGRTLDKKLPMKAQPYYDEVKNALSEISKILRKNNKRFIYKNGRNSADGVKYPEMEEDLLAEKRSKHKRLRKKQIERIIETSENLFPSSWIAESINEDKVLKNQKRPSFISFNQNPLLKQIKLIPTFYDAVENKKVLSLRFSPGFEELVDLYFHPYFLKEYNQRWFIFGRSTTIEEPDKATKYGIIPVDRIVDNSIELAPDNIPYVENSTDWQEYFKYIVGVSKCNGKPRQIVVETLDKKTFKRMYTNPLTNQKCLIQHDDKKKVNGRFEITVIPNEELVTALLQYRSGIRILSPKKFREKFLDEIRAMVKVYEE